MTLPSKSLVSARVEELKAKCAELTESCVERQAELDDANGKMKRMRRRVRRFKDAGQEAIAKIESLKKENSVLKAFVLERDKIIARQNQNIIAANIVAGRGNEQIGRNGMTGDFCEKMALTKGFLRKVQGGVAGAMG
jgi:hypothetical protein